VISTYPGSTEVTGRLRRRGRLAIPCVAAITDLAALRFWACRGIDLHLVTQAESIPEVRAIAGPATDIRHVRGLSDPRFATALPGRSDARAHLSLPPDVPVGVVSGGGWAVGDLAGAAEAVLAADPRARVLILCGTSEPRRAELAARFADEPRVRVLGFTDRMPDVLAAADVLIHSTAGLTVMEALIVGCRVISYGWGVGHIRANNAAFAAHGLATVVADRASLRAAVRDALARPGRPDPSFAALPTAAAVIAERYG
jgi:UDP-N-acetylglucosamine:LPS N-acetylglucosamine transferase